jgi:long-chain acyl-CoA synthetase
MNLGDLLHNSAVQNPGKPALIFNDEVVSYQQLDDSTTRLARWFRREGLQPGDRVGVHWSNSIEVVTLFFACFKAGLIAVPVNIRMKAQEIGYVLTHSKAVLCFSQPALAPLAQEAGPGCPALRDIFTDLRALPTSESDRPALPEVDADAPAILLYTSGTTARPKGVTHTHRSLLDTAKLMRGVAPDSMQTVLVMTQMMHTSGINCDLLPAISLGSTAVLVAAFDAALVLDLIERYHCTFTMGLPSAVPFILEEQLRKPRDISSMRTFIAGGDSVPVSTQERFQAMFGIPLREGYGMTESLPSIFNPADAIRPGSLGKVVDGVEVRVADANGHEVPDGQTGEIAVRSPANCVGYWDDPQATAEALRDGWLYTGDLGRRDADGYFWFEGRKKEIIIHGGSNISPQEVEEAIYKHPSVLESAVIGMPDPAYGEQVIAFVSLREGAVASEQELIAFARQQLADYKVPERILFLAELPKGITGKLQRRVLKQMVKTTAG